LEQGVFERSLADRLSIRTDEIQLDVGAFWFHHDVENRGFFSPDFREGIEQFYSGNFGGNLNFVSRYELFGHRNMLTIGLSPQHEKEPTQNYENIFGHTGAPTARAIGTWTIEVGTRGEYSRFEWGLALYRSWFRDELLEINDAFGNDLGARNVPRTIHQGIEASLEVELLEGILVPKQSSRPGDRLSLEQGYRLNDFHMDQNAVYGNNRLPGIPVHV